MLTQSPKSLPTEYVAFGERLRALGFSEDIREGAPLCRWVHARVILDVMPLDEKILGFSNRWYRAAMETATVHRLSQDLEIRVVTAPYFLATKIEAFRSRGRGDFRASHDLEDLIFVIDGKAAIVKETQVETPLLREYLHTEINRLLATPGSLTPCLATCWPMLRVRHESGQSLDG